MYFKQVIPNTTYIFCAISLDTILSNVVSLLLIMKRKFKGQFNRNLNNPVISTVVCIISKTTVYINYLHFWHSRWRIIQNTMLLLLLWGCPVRYLWLLLVAYWKSRIRLPSNCGHSSRLLVHPQKSQLNKHANAANWLMSMGHPCISKSYMN